MYTVKLLIEELISIYLLILGLTSFHFPSNKPSYDFILCQNLHESVYIEYQITPLNSTFRAQKFNPLKFSKVIETKHLYLCLRSSGQQFPNFSLQNYQNTFSMLQSFASHSSISRTEIKRDLLFPILRMMKCHEYILDVMYIFKIQQLRMTKLCF